VITSCLVLSNCADLHADDLRDLTVGGKRQRQAHIDMIPAKMRSLSACDLKRHNANCSQGDVEPLGSRRRTISVQRRAHGSAITSCTDAGGQSKQRNWNEDATKPSVGSVNQFQTAVAQTGFQTKVQQHSNGRSL
jgi:hypothetical protein